MSVTILIVPGYHGSGPDHWQSWLEARQPDARRVTGIDWDSPVLADWALEIRREIDESVGPVWIVAHSFGCLASVVAIADRADKVAGAILVAPADPNRFTPLGARGEGHIRKRRFAEVRSVKALLPSTVLPVMGLVVASRNDPWMQLEHAQYWAQTWGFAFLDVGNAGHINVESGHGPWPQIQTLLTAMRNAVVAAPVLGSLDRAPKVRRGRGGALANARKHTRRRIQYV